MNSATVDVGVSLAEYVTEDVGEEVEKVEEDASEEFVEEAAAHMKMGLKSQMSHVTLKIYSGANSQKRK